MIPFMQAHREWVICTMISVIVLAFRCLWLPAKWRRKLCKACAILDAHFEKRDAEKP